MYSENNPNAYQKSVVPPPPLYGQPAATGYPVQQGIEGPWSSDLCDCFSDVPSCCLTYWCPCITFGRIADIVEKGSPSCGASGGLYAVIALLTGCSWIYSCFNRSNMRRQYMLQEDPCSDCCVHFWCEKCALCQEYRELQSRGFDMSLGWQGNLNRQNQEVAMSPSAPMMEQGMRR